MCNEPDYVNEERKKAMELLQWSVMKLKNIMKRTRESASNGREGKGRGGGVENEKDGSGQSNTGTCSASIPRFVHIRKAVDTYQNIRHKGYKGWDPQRWYPNAIFPLDKHDQPAKEKKKKRKKRMLYKTGRKVTRSSWGGVGSNVFDMHARF